MYIININKRCSITLFTQVPAVVVCICISYIPTEKLRNKFSVQIHIHEIEFEKKQLLLKKVICVFNFLKFVTKNYWKTMSWALGRKTQIDINSSKVSTKCKWYTYLKFSGTCARTLTRILSTSSILTLLTTWVLPLSDTSLLLNFCTSLVRGLHQKVHKLTFMNGRYNYFNDLCQVWNLRIHVTFQDSLAQELWRNPLRSCLCFFVTLNFMNIFIKARIPVTVVLVDWINVDIVVYVEILQSVFGSASLSFIWLKCCGFITASGFIFFITLVLLKSFPIFISTKNPPKPEKLIFFFFFLGNKSNEKRLVHLFIC